MAKQTLVQAVFLIVTGKNRVMARACDLSGKPIGGWPETQQALRAIVEEIPAKGERTYSVSQLIECLYEEGPCDRWQRRSNDEAFQKARELSAK